MLLGIGRAGKAVKNMLRKSLSAVGYCDDQIIAVVGSAQRDMPNSLRVGAILHGVFNDGLENKSGDQLIH